MQTNHTVRSGATPRRAATRRIRLAAALLGACVPAQAVERLSPLMFPDVRDAAAPKLKAKAGTEAGL